MRDFLSDIDAYLEQRRISETALGKAAVNDGKFVSRIRSGKGVTVRLVERVREYMRENPPEQFEDERRPIHANGRH